jgi:phosphonate transport system substrate-binding protein
MEIDRPEYILSVHPLHNPALLAAQYQPLIDRINDSTTQFHLRLETSRDYPAFEEKLFAGKFHFALPNPYEAIRSLRHGYRIFGKMGDDSMFCGLVVVRRDGRIHTIEDLRGASISFPARTALAATLMPKLYLLRHGVNVEKESSCRYVGSQESAIMNVFLGHTDVACTWPVPWMMITHQRPVVAAEMEVRWRTEQLLNNPIVARTDLPQEHVQTVARVLFSLVADQRGREILQQLRLSCFEPADDRAYGRVGRFLDEYEQAFGPIAEEEGKNP